jgi:ethanolamine utilization protein EutQ (cupin superfamily)
MKIKAKDLKKILTESKTDNANKKNISVRDMKKILMESKTNNANKKRITVKDLKQKLNESNGLGFGYGFKNQHSSYGDLGNPNAKNQKKSVSKVKKSKDYMGKNGGTMFGYGFALQEQLEKLSKDPKKLASLVENMVKSMKGKSDYTNLKFVDNVAKKYNVNESEVKKMKAIILKENSPKTALKLYNYITECSCQQAESAYGKYSGLKNESSEMIPNIKRTFNKYQSSANSSQDAFGATSESLKIPREMVEEMVEIQKEAQKMKTEGQGNNITETDSKLQNVFEKYQKMSEGDMYEMYDEMAEYMDYPSSDDITTQAINDGSIYERDDFDSVVGGGDDDDRFDNKFSLRDMQRGIDAEPDEYAAYGQHKKSNYELGLDDDYVDPDSQYDFSDEDDLEDVYDGATTNSRYNFDEDGDIVDMHRYDDAFDNFGSDTELDESDDIEIGDYDESDDIEMSNYMANIPWHEMSLEYEENFKAERMNPDGQFDYDWESGF